MPIPNTYTERNETGCCAVPNVEGWDRQTISFENRPFIRRHTRSIFYIPLNMGAVMTALQKDAATAGATTPPTEAMILSRERSPFKAEQLYAVSRPVPGADNVTLSGTFVTRVFEGPYKNAGKWMKEVTNEAKARGTMASEVYFFYTTCPKCAKHYGKNYVIALAKVA